MTDTADERLAHLAADADAQRTHAVRTIDSLLPLLIDARHALNHGAPDVTDEFLDRTITALTAEVALLRVPAGS